MLIAICKIIWILCASIAIAVDIKFVYDNIKEQKFGWNCILEMFLVIALTAIMLLTIISFI